MLQCFVDLSGMEVFMLIVVVFGEYCVFFIVSINLEHFVFRLSLQMV